jgi:hypothetical protein
VFFLDGKSFIKELDTTRKLKSIEVLENNLVASYIKDKVEEKEHWVTTATELLWELKQLYPYEKSIPATPNAMSREIKKIATDLEAFGVKVEFNRTYSGRQIVFRKLRYDQPKEEPPVEQKQQTAPVKTIEEIPSDLRAKIKTIAIINYLLSQDPIAGIKVDTDGDMRRVMMEQGLSVGRKGICICMTKEAVEAWKNRRDIATDYKVYLIDDILKAFPEIQSPKKNT